MKIRKSFEQAVCIMLILATGNKSYKSSDLSKILDVSDSYLKKITRQLVVAGLISSKASKLGGFTLNRPTSNITFLDIFNAIEGTDRFAEANHLVEKVFHSNLPINNVESYILEFLNTAEDNYRSKLAEINLKDIIDAAHNGNLTPLSKALK